MNPHPPGPRPSQMPPPLGQLSDGGGLIYEPDGDGFQKRLPVIILGTSGCSWDLNVQNISLERQSWG